MATDCSLAPGEAAAVVDSVEAFGEVENERRSRLPRIAPHSGLAEKACRATIRNKGIYAILAGLVCAPGGKSRAAMSRAAWATFFTALTCSSSMIYYVHYRQKADRQVDGFY